MSGNRMGLPTEGLHERPEAQKLIWTIGKLTPATKQKAMAKVAELANGQPISEWDPDRLRQLRAHLHEIDPAREAGALQLAELGLTECQQVAATAMAEYVGITWPVDEAFAEVHEIETRDLILGTVAEHDDRLARVWDDVDRDEAKMRAAVTATLGLVDDRLTLGDALGSPTIDTADTTADNDGEVDWEAVASQQLADLYQMRDDIIGRAGDIDRLLSTLADGVQDVIDRIEAMIPNEGAQ